MNSTQSAASDLPWPDETMLHSQRQETLAATVSLAAKSSHEAEVKRILREHGFAHLPDHFAHAASHVLGCLSPHPHQVDASRQCSARPVNALYHNVKRMADIALSGAALLALAPVIVAISLAIYLEDGGPILYSQQRTGQWGQEFRFYKFRSMVKNADDLKVALYIQNEATGPIFKMKNDPRVTKIGRFIRRTSLDELPQLFSVLRGDLTLIGPRPLYTPEAARLTPRHAQRHQVKPGILCLREVCGRSALEFEHWMELDLVYIASRSLKTDITILMRAIPKILRSEGAY